MSLTPEFALLLRDRMVTQYETEAKTTLRVLKNVPADRLAYKPHEKSFTLGDLVWHIVKDDSWFAHSISKACFDQSPIPGIPAEKPATLAEIIALYETATPQRVAELKAMSADQLLKPTDFMGMCTLPNVEYLCWLNSHSTHHRGELAVYIRLTGGKVPSIYGPSADEAMPGK